MARYKTQLNGEIPTVAGKLPIGETVTIKVVDKSDTLVPLTSDACAESSHLTGVYFWGSTNITTPPTVFTEYFYEMTAATSGQKFTGKLIVGGYADQIKRFGFDKNVAVDDFLFPMFDNNGLAPGLTVTGYQIIDDGSLTPLGSITEVSGGTYKTNFTKAQLNGNNIAFIFTAPGANPTTFTIRTNS